MNLDRIKGSWKQTSGKLKALWGKLTNNGLTIIGGRWDELVGKVQHGYGVAKDKSNRLFKRSLGLFAVVALSMSCVAAQAATKPLTITQRQHALANSVSRGQRTGALTPGQAASLRHKESRIIAKEGRMKWRHGGHLSSRNVAHVQHDLDKMSSKIKRQEYQNKVAR